MWLFSYISHDDVKMKRRKLMIIISLIVWSFQIVIFPLFCVLYNMLKFLSSMTPHKNSVELQKKFLLHLVFRCKLVCFLGKKTFISFFPQVNIFKMNFYFLSKFIRTFNVTHKYVEYAVKINQNKNNDKQPNKKKRVNENVKCSNSLTGAINDEKWPTPRPVSLCVHFFFDFMSKMSCHFIDQ